LAFCSLARSTSHAVAALEIRTHIRKGAYSRAAPWCQESVNQRTTQLDPIVTAAHPQGLLLHAMIARCAATASSRPPSRRLSGTWSNRNDTAPNSPAHKNAATKRCGAQVFAKRVMTSNQAITIRTVIRLLTTEASNRLMISAAIMILQRILIAQEDLFFG